MGVLGLEDAVEKVVRMAGENDVFIGIGGGTGSGKSYMASLLKRRLGARVIAMDDYYRGEGFVEKELGGNYDLPEAVEIERLKNNVLNLMKGETITKPVYDMSLSRRIGEEEVEPGGSFVVEGLFALGGGLAELWDISVYMKVKKETMLKRRMGRDREKKRRHVSASKKNYFEKVAWPMHLEWVAPTRKNADIVVFNG